ncbi:hypothetical protein AB1Y20_002684 [Prymnesium parvum]|uniref:TLC domain-containing protein n=1 Tax=Prymnesium parvum TaxID=97485 RepID=A0AB34J9S1_PRYPA
MQGLCLALLAATTATPPQAGTFPDPSLLGGVGGVLFALHVCTWLLCSSFGRLTTTGANVVAHFVATLFGFGALAATGVYGWVIHPPAESLSRTRGIHFPGEVATNLMTAFQIYEVTLALLVPVLRGKHYEMLVHHIMTLSLAVLGGYYQYLSYYASFFFGLTELSSVRQMHAPPLRCHSLATTSAALRSRFCFWRYESCIGHLYLMTFGQAISRLNQ